MFKVLLEVLMSASSSASVCPHLCVHSNVHLEHPLTASANIHIVVGVISQRNDYCIARAKPLAVGPRHSQTQRRQIWPCNWPTNSLACKPRSENSNTAGRSKT
ncbi:hypothetical protein V8E53_005728 [Lactarius tabidus]